MTPIFFDTPAAFRAWLEAHHATERELLVGFYKRHTKKPSLTWPESVDEALSFGWIDGVRKSLSVDAYTIRFTPRKPGSTWSAINVARVKELEAQGRMAPAGLRAFAARTPERTGTYSYERLEAAKLTPAQEKILGADGRASAFFDAQPPWYRRTAMHWVNNAKREATREQRLARLVADSAAGRTIPPLTRPVGSKKAGPVSTEEAARRDAELDADPSRGRPAEDV
jgi:uncharacterized protein YdeI (YjbR/CyaY-like superfamily)